MISPHFALAILQPHMMRISLGGRENGVIRAMSQQIFTLLMTMCNGPRRRTTALDRSCVN